MPFDVWVIIDIASILGTSASGVRRDLTRDRKLQSYFCMTGRVAFVVPGSVVSIGSRDPFPRGRLPSIRSQPTLPNDIEPNPNLPTHHHQPAKGRTSSLQTLADPEPNLQPTAASISPRPLASSQLTMKPTGARKGNLLPFRHWRFAIFAVRIINILLIHLKPSRPEPSRCC